MNPLVNESRRVLDSRDSVPVFPLPGVVFFPHALLPLHIFEPRYRRMTADALGSDRLIAISLLGSEIGGREGGDSIAPLASAGVIEAAARLPDGRYLLRLRGIARIELIRFVRQEPYRIARFRRIEDRNEVDGPDVAAEKHRLLALCAGLRHEVSGSPGQAVPIDENIPFSAAVNTLCQTLKLEASFKLHLLRLDDVRERCRLLIQVLTKRWHEIAGARSGEGSNSDGIH